MGYKLDAEEYENEDGSHGVVFFISFNLFVLKTRCLFFPYDCPFPPFSGGDMHGRAVFIISRVSKKTLNNKTIKNPFSCQDRINE
jgi:hypothetical protein